MCSLRMPPGTPTTMRPFQSAGRRSTQRASTSSAMPPVTWSPGTVRVIAVLNGASGDTAAASARGVNAYGGSPTRELSWGIVSAFAVVRSALITQRMSAAMPASTRSIAAQSACAGAGAMRNRSNAMRIRTRRSMRHLVTVPVYRRRPSTLRRLTATRDRLRRYGLGAAQADDFEHREQQHGRRDGRNRQVADQRQRAVDDQHRAADHPADVEDDGGDDLRPADARAARVPQQGGSEDDQQGADEPHDAGGSDAEQRCDRSGRDDEQDTRETRG